MSKRSNFERRERDFYPTPFKAVPPLARHLTRGTSFDEPCAGNGALIDHLESLGFLCRFSSDIEPQHSGISKFNALDINERMADCFITNPPWPMPSQKGEPVISLIIHLSDVAPTWLLLPADFKHNLYFSKVENRCRKIQSIGRVKWIPDTKNSGKDNCAWYLFDKPNKRPTQFFGRLPKEGHHDD